MSDYYLVKLKPDCRWLDEHGDWTPNRKQAYQYTRDIAYVDAGHAMSDGADVVVISVRRVKRKTIPMPRVVADGHALTVNGKLVSLYEGQGAASFAARDLRRALGIPEET